MKSLRIGFLAAAVVGLVAVAAPAATINFGAGQNISGPSDVKTNGTVVRAYDFNGAGNLQINGVNFVSFPGTSADTQSGFGGAYNGYGSGGQTGDYATLLTNGIYRDSAATSLTLTGLMVGTMYQVQVFVDDYRNTGNRTETISGDTGGTTGSVMYGQNDGQYVVGTFTADSMSQVLNFNLVGSNTNNAQINGLVLSSLPEPGSLSLIALGALGLLARRRRPAR